MQTEQKKKRRLSKFVKVHKVAVISCDSKESTKIVKESLIMRGVVAETQREIMRGRCTLLVWAEFFSGLASVWKVLALEWWTKR